jgi:oligosaccharide repeat unit polymerase
MESLAFFVLVATSGLILVAGFMRPNGYMQLPCLTAAVFLGWVVPQLWGLRSSHPDIYDSYLATLHIFCLACLLATVWGWRAGVKSARKAVAPRQSVSDSTLVKICIALTAVAVLMSAAIGSSALEERASATWSGPLTIMYFFSNLKVISLFLSIYLTLKMRRPTVWVLLAVNLFLYAPVVFLAFRRRGMLELFTCVILAFWFARRTIFPRVLIVAAMPIGILIVFAVGELRQLSLGEDGSRTWVAVSDLAKVNYLETTPFTNNLQTPELNNALNIVRFSGEYGVHTFGATSWNRIVFQWVPGQIVGAGTKQALMLNTNVPEHIAEIYNEDVRLGSTPTAMGEAYLEFWFFGAIFFYATAFMMGRWWRQSHQGDQIAMMLYASGLAVAVLMPTAYAIYFFNTILLYGGAILGSAHVLAVHRRASRRRHRTHVTRRFRSPTSGQ